MNVTFARMNNRGVCITYVNGRPISPIMIYASGDSVKETAVLNALNSGILGRITAAILKS